jgi:protein-disulfide isomerase
VFRVVRLLPEPARERALFGSSALPSDLFDDVDLDRDHVRGDLDGVVTLVEYADFECPYCGQAEPIVEELLEDGVGLRYVWRHLPLSEVHPHAQLAAEASEAAHSQGKFWEMHDVLLDHQGALTITDLMGYARVIGLDVDRFLAELRSRRHAGRVDADVETADASEVAATPTFFINGQRYTGPVETEALREAVALARQNSRAAAALED